MVHLYLKNEKKIKVALIETYGIGKKMASYICFKVGISDSLRVKQLSYSKREKIKRVVQKMEIFSPPHKILYLNTTPLVDKALKVHIETNINRLIKMGCYKGFRHIERLPCHGQRTHGNARTVRRIKLINYRSRH